MSLARSSWMLLAACLALGTGCKRQHYAASSLEQLPYPTCAGGAGSAGAAGSATAPETIVETHLRSGSTDTRMPVVEHFKLERRGCLYAAVTRQEWPMQIADVEALYDESWTPLRVWRRHTVPGSRRADGQADYKVFELRTTPVGIRHKADSGAVDLETLRAPAKPRVLIGQGRGIISVWLRQAKLAVGQTTREIALDFRGVEKIERAALTRREDVRVDALGRVARVYTFFGKETVYADEDDVVIGDLAGLVPDALAKTPRPPPMSRYEPIDPVGTP